MQALLSDTQTTVLAYGNAPVGMLNNNAIQCSHLHVAALFSFLVTTVWSACIPNAYFSHNGVTSHTLPTYRFVFPENVWHNKCVGACAKKETFRHDFFNRILRDHEPRLIDSLPGEHTYQHIWRQQCSSLGYVKAAPLQTLPTICHVAELLHAALQGTKKAKT